jgi:Sigma-70, region 4
MKTVGPVGVAASRAHHPDEVLARPGNGVPNVADIHTVHRVLDLTYRIARLLGHSPQASEQICRQVLRRRVVGAQSISAIRTALEPVNDERFAAAVADATLCDELAQLPPRQQTAVRLAVEQHYTVAQIAGHTGWTTGEVVHLLRAGLRTVNAPPRPA